MMRSDLVRTQEIPPFSLKVFYEERAHRFRIVITHEDGRKVVDHVPATYAPQFGIDFLDNEAISDKAEQICRRMEKQK